MITNRSFLDCCWKKMPFAPSLNKKITMKKWRTWSYLKAQSILLTEKCKKYTVCQLFALLAGECDLSCQRCEIHKQCCIVDHMLKTCRLSSGYMRCTWNSRWLYLKVACKVLRHNTKGTIPEPARSSKSSKSIQNKEYLALRGTILLPAKVLETRITQNTV